VVSKSAQNTISGTIRIRIKVLVDAAGNVESANFISAGPSKYFSRQAMQAAQEWKFSPAQAAARAWILHFGFRRSGIEVDSEPVKP
jgi:TonB family protein